MECRDAKPGDARLVLRKHRDFVPRVGTVGAISRE